MKQLLLIICSLVILSSFTAAHQRDIYNISGKNYLVTIGSLNEPIFVDDKTGVDLRVKLADNRQLTNFSAIGAKPVTGLETTLQVEISADGQKKVFDLEPAYNDAGAYRAPFYPTAEVVYTYRFFGTINGTEVDFSASCKPHHDDMATADTEVQLSDKVTRVSTVGAFGCPESRSEVTFPHEILSAQELTMKANKSVKTMVALVLSVVALALSAFALTRTRKKKA